MCKLFPCLFALVIALFAICGYSADRLHSVEIDNPRTYGYYSGDVFVQTTHIKVASEFQLTPESAPKKGKVSPWIKLDLVTLEDTVSADIRYLKLVLRYQIIGYQIANPAVNTPPFTLVLQRGREKIPVIVPPLGITVSRLVSAGDQTAISDLPVAPAIGPAHKSARNYSLLRRGSFIVAAILFLWLLYSLVVEKNANRPGKPFGAAYGRVKKHLLCSPPQLLEARRELHHAFNRRMGKTVFESELDAVLETDPVFARHEAAIRRFYADSTQLFFAGGQESNVDDEPQELLALARQCARSESRSLLRKP